MKENSFEKAETDPFAKDKMELDSKIRSAILDIQEHTKNAVDKIVSNTDISKTNFSDVDSYKKYLTDQISGTEIISIKMLQTGPFGNPFDMVGVFLKNYKEMYRKYSDTTVQSGQTPEKEDLSSFENRAKQILEEADKKIADAKSAVQSKIEANNF
jgi:hypothetical protein